jgi:hypothetical protein
MRIPSLLVLALIGVLTMFGCGDDGGGAGDCTSVCDEAQSRDCTSIRDCTAACESGATVAGASGCDGQFDAYVSCATSQEDVCTVDAACDSQLDAFSQCAGAYCLSHASDPDCQALLGAL